MQLAQMWSRNAVHTCLREWPHFSSGDLVALLVRLSRDDRESTSPAWHLETMLRALATTATPS